MPRFFIDAPLAADEKVCVLSGEDARHIAFSLRARIGDRFTLCGPEGMLYDAAIRAFTKETVTFDVLYRYPCENEPPVFVTLYQALPKGDKLENVVQKAVELGVSRIVPVLSARCVSRPDERTAEKKRERLQKIVRAAAMQSERGMVPQVLPLVPYERALGDIAGTDLGFVCYEREPHMPLAEVFAKAKAKGDIRTAAFFIGPEGGLDEKEAQSATERGLPLASLGKRILRTETAPLAVLAALMFDSGCFS